MSGPDGVERTPLPETHSLTVPDRAPGDPDSPRCLKLREETEASQVMAETGEGSFEAVALPPSQLPEERGAPRAAPAGPVCAGKPHIGGGGDGGYVAPEAGQEQAPPPRERLETASVSLATDGSRGNGGRRGEPRGSGGEKALEACGAERFGSELMAEAKAEEVKTEEGPLFSVAVDERAPSSQWQWMRRWRRRKE